MRRALGTLTTWPTFEKATQDLDVYAQEQAQLQDDQESEHRPEGLAGNEDYEQAHSDAKHPQQGYGITEQGLGQLHQSKQSATHHTELTQQGLPNGLHDSASHAHRPAMPSPAKST